MSVWQDNISKILLFKKIRENEDQTSRSSSQKNIKHDDIMVKKLEDFLAHNETALCEINVKLTLEGLQLNLFLDTEEVDIHFIYTLLLYCFISHIFYYFVYRVAGIEFSST